MSAPAYKPAPGSLAARVIEYFISNPDEELNSLDVALKFDRDPATVTAGLRPAVHSGALACEPGGRAGERSVYRVGPHAAECLTGAGLPMPAEAPSSFRMPRTLFFTKLHPGARLPEYGSLGAACFDFFAAEDAGGFGRVTVRTGLAVEVQPGYRLALAPRSGLAFKTYIHGFSGTIDADYRGEIKVLLVAEHPMHHIEIERGQAVIQGSVEPSPQYRFAWAKKPLSATARGANGFGSTDKCR